MSYLPKEPKDPKKVSTSRLLIWIGAGGIGVYMIIEGIIGVVSHG
jgi:hypothetical protein